MDNGLRESDIQTIRDVLKQHPEVETAVLYGSRALGTWKKGSDIDLALKGKQLSSRICSQIHFELEEDTWLPYFFDISHYETINNKKLKAHIDQVGQTIYSSSYKNSV